MLKIKFPLLPETHKSELLPDYQAQKTLLHSYSKQFGVHYVQFPAIYLHDRLIYALLIRFHISDISLFFSVYHNDLFDEIKILIITFYNQSLNFL